MKQLILMIIVLSTSACQTNKSVPLDACFLALPPLKEFNLPSDSQTTKAEYREVAITRTIEAKFYAIEYDEAAKCARAWFN